MNKITNLSLLIAVFLISFTFNIVSASEVTGTLNTGMGGTTGTLSGTVVTPVESPSPTPIPPAPSGGGGGGGSGSGGSIWSIYDINHDGKVNILEFVKLMSEWNKTGPGYLTDFNRDNIVNILDFVLLMANWTK